MKNKYLVKYHNGLGQNKIFEAENEIEAKKMAIVEYRRTSGTWENVDTLPIELVIQDVSLIKLDEGDFKNEQ